MAHIYLMGLEVNMVHSLEAEVITSPLNSSIGISAIIPHQKVIPQESGGELRMTIEKLIRERAP